MIAVTGATGFLGSHLVDVLRERDLAVVGVSRRPAAGGRVADLADEDGLAAAFAGCTAVVANAALSPGWSAADEEAFRAANVAGTENTLRAAARAGARRVVLVSSVSVYRTRLGIALREDAEQIDPDGIHLDWSRVTTRSGYSRTKAIAEKRAWALAAELGLALTAVRPGPIVGPRDPKLTPRLRRWASRRWPVPTVRLPLVHVRDVAAAVASALVTPAAAGRSYNLAGPPVPLRDVVSAIAGARRLPLPVPVRIAYDCSAAARDLGFVARDVALALVSER